MPELAKPISLAGRGGCSLACGAQELHVEVEAGFRPAKKAHPDFLVKNLAAVQAKLKAANVDIFHQPRLPHARRIFVEDPFGNRMEHIDRD